MRKWTLTTWVTAVFLVVCGAAAFFVLGFALRMSGETTDSLYNYEATACVEIRATAISEMVRARSTASALETRVAGVAFAEACTPDATQQARVAEVETRAAELDCILVDVVGIIVKAFPDVTPCASRTPTIVTPEPTATPSATPRPTSRPTWTPDVLPTVAVTPTPDPWCRLCGDSTGSVYGTPRFNCPPGFWCQLCMGGQHKCVRATSDCAKCPASMPVASPIWLGLAVYHGEQRETASGEPFDGSAMTCAVDVSLFTQFVNRILHICVIPGYGVNEARCVDVRVTDSGPLGRAGLFVYESRPRGTLSVTRWWQGDGADALPIVVDLTPAAMDALTNGSMETCAVQVTLLDLTSGQNAVQ